MKKQIVMLTVLGGMTFGGFCQAEEINPERSILFLNNAYSGYGEEMVSVLDSLIPAGSYEEEVSLSGDFVAEGILGSLYRKGAFELKGSSYRDNSSYELDFEGTASAKDSEGMSSLEGTIEGILASDGVRDFIKLNRGAYQMGEESQSVGSDLINQWVLLNDLEREGRDLEVFWNSIIRSSVQDIVSEVLMEDSLFGASKPIQTINSPYGVETHVPVEISNEKILEIVSGVGVILKKGGMSSEYIEIMKQEIAEKKARVAGNFIFTETKNPFLDLAIFSGENNVEERLMVTFKEDIEIQLLDFENGKPLIITIGEGFYQATLEGGFDIEVSKTEVAFVASLKLTKNGSELKEMVGIDMQKGAGDSWSGILIFPHFFTGQNALVAEIKEFVATSERSVLRLNFPIDGMGEINLNMESNSREVESRKIEIPTEWIDVNDVYLMSPQNSNPKN